MYGLGKGLPELGTLLSGFELLRVNAWLFLLLDQPDETCQEQTN